MKLFKYIWLILCLTLSAFYSDADITENLVSRKKQENSIKQSLIEDSIFSHISKNFVLGTINEDSIYALAEVHNFRPLLAERILKIIVTEENAKAIGELGRLYIFNYQFKDKKEDGRLLLQLANEKGYQRSQLYMAMDDYYSQRYDLAWTFLSQYNCEEYAPGLNALGNMTLNGRGTDKNEPLGFQYIKRAAVLGFSLAMNMMPILYSKGIGCREDNQQAFIWYYVTGDLGYDASRVMIHLPMLRDLSNSEDANEAKAYTMLKFTENLIRDHDFTKDKLYHGYQTSLKELPSKPNRTVIETYYLGSLYYNGEFQEKDYNKAFKYYSEIADNPVVPKVIRSQVCHRLGIMYRYGRGVIANNEVAQLYTQKASQLGNKKAYDIIYGFTDGNL